MLPRLLIGAAMGWLFVALARRWRREVPLAAWGLVLAALIYVGFALRTGSPGPGWLGVEIAGLAIFGTVAWLGARVSVWFLAAGWGAHAGWDFLHHLNQAPDFVPAWYPAWCGSLDLAVAALLAMPLCLQSGPKRKGVAPR